MIFLKRFIHGMFICFLITTSLYSREVTSNRKHISNLLKKLEYKRNVKEENDLNGKKSVWEHIGYNVFSSAIKDPFFV